MVYLALASNGMFKVGFSDNVKKRINGLRKEFDLGFNIVAVFDGSFDDEKIIHNLLSEYNVRFPKADGTNSREIFDVDQEIIEDIMFNELNNGIYYSDFIEMQKVIKPNHRFIKITNKAYNELKYLSSWEDMTSEDYLSQLILEGKENTRNTVIVENIKDMITKVR